MRIVNYHYFKQTFSYLLIFVRRYPFDHKHKYNRKKNPKRRSKGIHILIERALNIQGANNTKNRQENPVATSRSIDKCYESPITIPINKLTR